ncbi:MAG TPA: hypothetical protein VNG35_17120 [Gemmatimonadales bacterium]|nr:hypothetical protein [Gemmatimonadales bacterium]
MATVTLAQLKSTLFDYIGELYTGTATGGSVSTLADSGLIGYTSETWPAKLEGQQLRMTSGLASGDVRQVGKVDRSDGVLYPNRNFSAAVAAADTYELWGSAINGGAPLTTLFNMVIRGMQPITDTQVTIVTNQREYDISTLVSSRRDIKGVYVRLLDASGVVPYIIRDLVPGLEWWAYDRGGAGTLSTTLEVTPMALATSTQQLWLRAETAFPAFTTDTSTVDANYRDWLAVEAVLELTRRKQSTANYDKARWDALQLRCIQDLSSERNRWLPREPVVLATWP